MKGLPVEVREQMPSIEWPKIAGMRDWLAHAYFGIDDDILWDVVENHVMHLLQAVRAFSNLIPDQSPGPDNPGCG